MFPCACDILCAVQDEVSDVNRVELDNRIMEAYNAKLIECLSEEGISLDIGEEIQCFSKGCVVQFLLAML